MNDFKIDPEDQRKAVSILKEKGPINHEDLSEEIGYDWKKTQKIIRQLRNEDLVSITLDRRYRAEETQNSTVA